MKMSRNINCHSKDICFREELITKSIIQGQVVELLDSRESFSIRINKSGNKIFVPVHARQFIHMTPKSKLKENNNLLSLKEYKSRFAFPIAVTIVALITYAQKTSSSTYVSPNHINLSS